MPVQAWEACGGAPLAAPAEKGSSCSSFPCYNNAITGGGVLCNIKCGLFAYCNAARGQWGYCRYAG